VEELCKSFFPKAKNMGQAQQTIFRKYKNYLEELSKLPFPPVTLSELKNCVYSLKNKAAPGIDEIGLDIQTAYSILSDILLKFHNKCFELNHCPKVWKIAKVTCYRSLALPQQQIAESFT
jgi:hypothetical protein